MSNEKSDIEKMYADYMENMKVLISDFPQYSVHSNYPEYGQYRIRLKRLCRQFILAVNRIHV